MSSPKPKTFHFKGYKFNAKDLKISFYYRIEFLNRKPLNFKEVILLPSKIFGVSQKSLENFLEPLSIILGISYYKLYCPSKIKLSFSLSKEQADFWNTVYRKGLGEFLYKNKINPNKIAKFPYSKKTKKPLRIEKKERALIGIGGGKDSIVASEILKGFPSFSFYIQTEGKNIVLEKVVKKIGNPSLKAVRILDPKIFQNHEGGYNGHIPISAVFAFIGLLLAFLYNFRYVIVGNEKSSNFGNVSYCNENINHQWSKSKEFEKMFQDYSKKFITPDIVYFSILRPFYEIKIAKIFAKYKKYFPLFTSCNNSFKVFKKRGNSLWCGNCPKCAFVFLILSPFLSKIDLYKIFKKNLLEEDKLFSTFKDILGFGNMKPFDCVGTFEEARAALFLSSKKYKNSPVVQKFLPLIKNSEKLVEKVFETRDTETIPDFFRIYGKDKVCIIGYGKEGKSAERYIKKFHPNINVGILDMQFDKNYLQKQKKYDLAIKTPGIPKEKIKIPYTTAVNIFFSKNRNYTIGITGTKGKSTTSSLIFQILKESGRKVRLIGNIGNPVLDVFSSKIDPKEIFVIELSSYMLSDINYSPNLALFLNFFPEHMDYHGKIENYYNAKMNIFKFQKEGDLSLLFPFKEKDISLNHKFPSFAVHNKYNIKAAIKAAKLLKIPLAVIKKGIENFKPLKHRLEPVGIYNEIEFYDDAASTTPQSTIMAIETLKKVDTIFLGGQDRGYDFLKLEKTLRKYKIKNVVLFPDSGKRILSSFLGFNILKTKSMEEAVRFAYKNTKKGKICLLSSASPSYSLWKNFSEKGDLFQKLVKKYSKKYGKRKK